MWELDIFVPPGGWIVADSGKFNCVFEQPRELRDPGGGGMCSMSAVFWVDRPNCGAKLASFPKSRRDSKSAIRFSFVGTQRSMSSISSCAHNNFTSRNGVIALPLIDDFCKPWKTAVLSV